MLLIEKIVTVDNKNVKFVAAGDFNTLMFKNVFVKKIKLKANAKVVKLM